MTPPWTAEDTKRWAPKWHGLVEERVTRACLSCGDLAKMRTVQFPDRKYGYLGRRFISQYWHDDAAQTSPNPLCKPCLGVYLDMERMRKIVP